MSVSIDTFWKLALESQSLSGEQQQRLAAEFGKIRGAAEAGASVLAEWLVSQRVLSRYQTKVLLAGRPGPFIYGEYQVIDRTGSGRLKGVYRAEHRPTGQLVCLSFLHGADAQDPRRFGHIAQLAAVASQVRSPYVARCYQAVALPAFKFLAFVDLQGQTLEQRLAQGPLPAAEVCRIGRQTSLGLAELHKSGQVHGELRPENIWLGSSGQAKLLAFPLHREPAAGPTTPANPDGKLAEMADYLAPEVIAGGTGDPRSDIYSLGCVLYQALTGQAPFAGGDVQQKLARHTGGENPPLANQAQPSVPEPVAQVIGYMLAKDPGGRYQQAEHVAESLAPYLPPEGAQDPQEPVTAASQAFESWLASQPQPAASPAAQAVPVQAAPVQANPAQASPVQANPVQAAPVQASPVQAGPIQAGPIQAGTVQPVSAQGTAAAQVAVGTAGGVQPKTASGSAGALAAQRAQRTGDRQTRNTMLACGGVLGAALVAIILFKAASEPEPEPEPNSYASTTPTRNVPSGAVSTPSSPTAPASGAPPAALRRRPLSRALASPLGGQCPRGRSANRSRRWSPGRSSGLHPRTARRWTCDTCPTGRR